MITTTKGDMDEAALEKREGVIDDDNEHTTWVEYYLDGELVHRSAHVILKPQVTKLSQAVLDRSITKVRDAKIRDGKPILIIP